MANLDERDFSQDRREKLADSGKAMSDGSFPIVNREDLKNAIRLWGNAKDPAAAKRHIIKRARALGAIDALPESWGISEAEVPVFLSEAMNGSVVDVLLIQAGTSKNRRRYRPEVLRESVPLFEGARAFAAMGPDHNASERGVKSLVGWYTDPRYVTGVPLPGGKTVEGVAAHFHISEAAPWLRSLIADAIRRGKPDLVGFSIVGDGHVQVMREARTNRPLHDVTKIDTVDSVDVVVRPAAGGVPLKLVASKEAPSVGTRTVVEAIQGLASGTVLPDELKDEDPELYESIVSGTGLAQDPEPEPPTEPEPPAPEPAVVGELDSKVSEAVASAMTPVLVESRLAEVKLPDLSKDRVRKISQGRTLSESEVEQLVKDEADYVASLNPALVTDAGPATSGMKDEKDKVTESIDKILSGESHDSFREIYIDLTGDSGMTGRLQPGGRLTESITSTTFTEIMGDSITRQMVREYTMAGLDQQWRPIVDVVPKRDFRTERRVRMGGYGALPAVNEGAAYAALTTPADEEATYTITKRGGTEDLTLEAIANDDLSAMRRIPQKLGRAAARTLHKFVFDFIATNPTIYDTTALFIAGHNNLAVTALSAASLSTARLAMKNQTQAGSAEKIGLTPRYLVVPNELEQTAYELTQTDREVGNANNTLNFARTFGLQVIVVSYLTDVNNWYLVADKGDVPTIEIAFFNGREEPELFLQDQPTLGTVFSNDKLTWKIRHIYGGAIIDFRGFTGNVVP